MLRTINGFALSNDFEASLRNPYVAAPSIDTMEKAPVFVKHLLIAQLYIDPLLSCADFGFAQIH